MQSDIGQRDYFTLAKLKVYEDALVVVIKPSCGHGSIDTMIIDVRIAIHPLSPWETPTILVELEAMILRATEPPYNVQIPPER
jgi:hypothetical protein